MQTDCVVVGAGPAGLATSRALASQGIEHVVLEAARVGEVWLTQRWDSDGEPGALAAPQR